MDLLYKILEILLVLQSNVSAVKIGVSKLSTISTTTLAPNISLEEINTTVTLPSITTTTLEIETSTFAAITKDSSTTAPQFPPKIMKPTKKTITTTTKTNTIVTTPNPTNDNGTTIDFTSLIADPAKAYSSNFYCYCDLFPSTCDINCCCDQDCAKKALKVFNCFSPPKHPELRLQLEDFQYEHGLPSCKINDGWLCVFRTNTRPPAKKVYQFDFDTTHNFKWPTSLMELTETEQSKEKDFYKFGEQLKVHNMETLEVQNFEIPYAYRPPLCQLKDPIRHLTSVSRDCLVTSLSAAQDIKQKFINFFATTKLLSKPRDQLTDSDDQKELTRDFVLRSCILNNKGKDYNCLELDALSNETDIHDYESYYVREIRIKVWHNFTDLIKCQIDFLEQELLSNEATLELWQKYSVSFIASNETESDHSSNEDITDSQLSFSGPLGYLQGEPIIISKFISNNESEELSMQNRILNYFKHRNALNNTLNLPSRRDGFCHQTHGKDFSINYGISSLTQCKLRIDKKSRTEITSLPIKKANLTEACVQFQQQITEAMFGVHAMHQLNDLSELYVSTLGRPQNASDKWLPLHVHNLDFAPIVGQLVDSQTLICHNILLSVAYEFHIGTFTENGIHQQALLKNAVLKLGQRHDLEFTLDENLEVPLTLSVMFYDLSSSIGCLIPTGTFFIYILPVFVCLRYMNFIV